MEIILTPFVWLLQVFYDWCGSYGLALILFAIVVKLILFPFSLKGKRSMIQMNMLSDKMNKLQKQYGKDKERYNLEIQKLYEKENVNPMGGCLWSFLPLLILLPLYAIIRQPLKYMMGINTQELLDVVANAVNWSSAAVDMGWVKEAADAAQFANTAYNQLYLSSLITPDNLASVQAALGEAGSRVFAINFDFLGLVDLSQIPQLKFWTIAGGIGLFLLPLISAVSGFLFSLLSMKTNAVNQKSAQAANNPSMKSMLIMSPLMSLWIGFSMPAALCIYWIANNLLSMIQELVSQQLLKKDYARAAAMQAERELRRAYDPYRDRPDGPTAYPGEAPLFVQQDSAEVPEEPEGLEVPMESALQPVLEESEVPEEVLEDDGAVLEDALEDGGAEAEAPYAEEAEESDESDETK